MPALFHGPELSRPGWSSRSSSVIDQSGCSDFSSEPSVALMIPAPTRSTSVVMRSGVADGRVAGVGEFNARSPGVRGTDVVDVCSAFQGLSYRGYGASRNGVTWS